VASSTTATAWLDDQEEDSLSAPATRENPNEADEAELHGDPPLAAVATESITKEIWL
jgi:hypothetical protein